MRRVIAVGLLSCASVLPLEGVARAQADEADYEARSLFEAGESAFADGRYEDALERFEAAYEMSPRPMLLFNIGNTADRLRREERAVEAYRGYLDALPEAPNRAEVEARIRILEQSLAARDGDPEPTDPPVREDAPRIFSWVFTGTTVLFAGLTTTFALVGSREYDDLDARCVAAGGCTEAEIDGSSVPTWQRLTNTFLALSIASAAAAVVFFILESGDGEADEPSVALGIGPGSVRLSGRF
jgi:tetratricopeptide (TPR) repeat protein